MPVKVILDANFLMIPAQFRIDIIEEMQSLLKRKIEPIVLTPTYRELEKIATSEHTKMGRQAELALKLAGECRVIEVKPEPNEAVDDLIARLAKECKCVVATNDQELRKKLKRIAVPTIFLRQKTHLACESCGKL